MYDFIVQSVAFVSLGIVVYLIARALPRVSNSETEHSEERITGMGFVSSITLEKADAFMNMLFEKLLRRLKVFVLRADNFITNSLGALKSKKEDRNNDDLSQ